MKWVAVEIRTNVTEMIINAYERKICMPVSHHTRYTRYTLLGTRSHSTAGVLSTLVVRVVSRTLPLRKDFGAVHIYTYVI